MDQDNNSAENIAKISVIKFCEDLLMEYKKVRAKLLEQCRLKDAEKIVDQKLLEKLHSIIVLMQNRLKKYSCEFSQ